MSSPSPWTQKPIYSSVPEQEKLHRLRSCLKWKPTSSFSWSSSWWTASATKRYPRPEHVTNMSQAVRGVSGGDRLLCRNRSSLGHSLPPRLFPNVRMRPPEEDPSTPAPALGKACPWSLCSSLWRSPQIVDGLKRVDLEAERPGFKSHLYLRQIDFSQLCLK